MSIFSTSRKMTVSEMQCLDIGKKEGKLAERESMILVLQTLLEAVSGVDQRFMEEQGIKLDNRSETTGAIKIINHLLED